MKLFPQSYLKDFKFPDDNLIVIFVPFLKTYILYEILCVFATSKIKFEGRNMNPLQGNVHYEIIATIIFKGFQIL